MSTPYAADPSLKGKLRRRFARLRHRRPARLNLARATVSFTFDDAPASAAVAGARVLESHGARGVYYICAGLFDRENHLGRLANAQEVAVLAARGHEIASHTFDHIDCHRASDDRLLDDAARNDAVLTGLAARPPRHFAFPYGELSPRVKRLLAPRYDSLRGVHAGLVRHGDDLNQLPGVGVEGADGERTARQWIDRAAAEGAWLILYTHDVRADPSPWGCTPETLDRLAAHAVASGCDIRTLSQVLG